VEKLEGKRPLGRPRHRWVDNIKMDLEELGLGGKDWIDLTQDGDKLRALVRAVLNRQVLYNAGKFLSGCTICNLLGSVQVHGFSQFILETGFCLNTQEKNLLCWAQVTELVPIYGHKKYHGA
jgi:hypothetical protein